MKKLNILSAIFIAGIGTVLFSDSCAVSEKLTAKTGAELWSENCLRCHNAPNPADYSDVQWEVVGTHMKLRVNSLSDVEVNKVVAFLKSTN